MKPLDVTASVDYGYRLIWVERAYLMRLAMAPLAIKLACLMIIMLVGWEQQYVRSTLIMLPSFFADGWMLSHLTRLVFLNQRWPFRPTGDAVQDGVVLNDRAYGISAGTLFFVVIQFLLAGVQMALLSALTGIKADMATSTATAQEPSAIAGVAAMMFLAFSLWAIRLMFLYIPAAVGRSTRKVVQSPNNTLLSLQTLGVVMICYIPLMMVANWAVDLFMPEGLKPADYTAAMRIILVAWQVLVNTLTYLITTASMAYGFKVMMDHNKP